MATKKEEAVEVVETKPKNLNEKLSAIQTRIKAPKNLYNSFGKYSYRNAEGILEAVKPYLTAYNLYLTIHDEIENIGERFYVKAVVEIVDCDTAEKIEVYAYAREEKEKKGMDGSQVTGATSSYARKYALNGLFLLDDTKDADTDEFHKATTKEEKKETKDWKAEIKELWDKAGGPEDMFEKWFTEHTPDGLTDEAIAVMRSSLMAGINKKTKEAKNE